uniref:Uncharacterized protein n=1 Tax=Biomphalaria glabrata TaxID=6526 RepID=A0A2C9M9J7_BIOGL
MWTDRSLDDEQSTVNWLRWLMHSDAQFDKISGNTDSPGEMLFLLALNFHNNQMTAITDLVCNTLGMKITVKTSALVKIRHIFTMELFTEQVVAAHAVKIPVTPNLDARCTGSLPVHSILQLLKSRVFSKHKVSIRQELPNLLNILDITEALLCVKNGSTLITQLVANNPEAFLDVCRSLISRGEKQEEDSLGGLRRLELLRMLCLVNPKAALLVRNFCAEYCSMPGFAVAVSLQLAESNQSEDPCASDIVPYFTGLLLGSDVTVRNWFSSFVKAGQKRKPDCMLGLLRKYLLDQLIGLTPVNGQLIDVSKIVTASSLLRLYNALKGIATLKYSDEETGCLLRLIISHPAPCTAGAHFIALGICTLIASPSLLS